MVTFVGRFEVFLVIFVIIEIVVYFFNIFFIRLFQLLFKVFGQNFLVACTVSKVDRSQCDDKI